VRYLLDTNICIFAMKGNAKVRARLEAMGPDALAISTVTLAELRFGALKSRHPLRARALADAFVAPFEVLEFDAGAAEHYAEIRLYLERRGAPIGERDLMIAAIGRSEGLTLVTNNRREFDRVPDLDVTDWAT